MMAFDPIQMAFAPSRHGIPHQAFGSGGMGMWGSASMARPPTRPSCSSDRPTVRQPTARAEKTEKQGAVRRPSTGRMCSCDTCGQPAVWCTCGMSDSSSSEAAGGRCRSRSESSISYSAAAVAADRPTARIFGLAAHRTGSCSDLKVLMMTNDETSPEEPPVTPPTTPSHKDSEGRIGLLPAGHRAGSFSDLKVLLMTEPEAAAY